MSVSLPLPSTHFALGQAVLAAFAQSSPPGESDPYDFDVSEDDYNESVQMTDALEAAPLSELQMTAQSFFGQPTDPLLTWTGNDTIPTTAGFAAIVAPNAHRYGDALRIVERDVFDSFAPRWMRPSGREVSDNYYRSYCMDANDPLAFWLWPCPVQGRKVWVTYAGLPVDLNDPGDTLSLPDIYIAPIVDYVVYRALAKESRDANREVAERFLRSFYAALGVHRPVLMSIGQNAQRAPDAPA